MVYPVRGRDRTVRGWDRCAHQQKGRSVSALAMQVDAPGAQLQPAHVPVTSPSQGWVRVRVVASGMCGADLGTADPDPDARFPVTPGHEVAGTVAELGPDVPGWQVGDRVAVGWFGGSCGHCPACRRGDLVHCPERRIPGISYPGGWAESITVPAQALARVPDALDLFDAAPLGCAGVTTFNAVRHCGAPAGGHIAVLGLGGLGHLAVQFARAMGYEVTVITRGSERADLARQLDATHYLDSTQEPVARALQAVGGVDAAISTAPTTAPLPDLLDGLGTRGRLVLLGVTGHSVDVPVGPLVMNARTIMGHVTGTPSDTEQAMQFAVTNQVRPVRQCLPLESAPEALQRLRAGQARLRLVLDATAERHG